MKVTLPEFSQHLCNLMADYPTDARPFVCDGSPLTCRIFIVGANAANSLRDSFWRFWNDDIGFDKNAFMRHFIDQREGKLGKARKAINLITDNAAPCRCLETNIWSRPTKHVKGLRARDRSTDIFDSLLKNIKPKIIYLHGRDAIKHFQDKLGNDFPLTERKRLVARFMAIS